MATDPRAPSGSVFAGGSASPGGPPSFEVYFLRDLLQRGKIDQKLIEDVMQQNGIQAPITDVMGAIKDASGLSLPRAIVSTLADIAIIIASNN